MRRVFPVFLLLIPSLAFANVIWPGFILAPRMVFWGIPAGIAIEVLIVRKWFQLTWARTLLIVCVSNAVSGFAGALGAAFGGLAFELTVGQVIDKLFNWATFHPVGWLGTILIAACVSYLVELSILKWIFKLSPDRKQKQLFLVANVLSAAVAYVSLIIDPWKYT